VRRGKPMANRHRKTRAPIEDLRRAIDCLPVQTRQAMLDGLRDGERIIAGAYVDGRGGVCPMLAAHRRGARTNFLSFARAWDRFARARRRVRLATRRELDILARQLHSSLLSESSAGLGAAIAEHRGLLRRRVVAQADPAGEIRATRGIGCLGRHASVGLRSGAGGGDGDDGTPPPTATEAPRRQAEYAARS
jgi:hypothetical protein